VPARSRLRIRHLTNERLLAERETFLGAVVENDFKSYEIETIRYDEGATDLLSVSQIQSRWVAGRIALLRIQNERLAQRINLHLALGGSFESSVQPESEETL